MSGGILNTKKSSKTRISSSNIAFHENLKKELTLNVFVDGSAGTVTESSLDDEELFHMAYENALDVEKKEDELRNCYIDFILSIREMKYPFLDKPNAFGDLFELV